MERQRFVSYEGLLQLELNETITLLTYVTYGSREYERGRFQDVQERRFL